MRINRSEWSTSGVEMREPADMLKRRPKCLIVYHYFAHYRTGILRQLMQSDRVDFDFASGVDAEVDGLLQTSLFETNSQDPAGRRRYQQLHNKWMFRRILWQKGLTSILMRSDYDAVIFLGNMYHLSTWWAAIVAKCRGIRTYMWGHGHVRSQGALEFARSIFYRLADGHFLYGNRARRLMIKRRFAPESLHVVYNSLDLEVQALPQSRFGVAGHDTENCAEQTLSMLFCGRITQQKNLALGIEALARLRSNGVNVKWVIVGDGPALPELKCRAHALGVGDMVDFRGAVYDGDQLAGLFSDADLCLIPGRVGLFVMHAFAHGVPVVTNDDFESQNPEVEAIESRLTGEFFRAGNADSLAEVISRWAEYRPDRRKSIVACQAVIQGHYNSSYQRAVFESVITSDCPYVRRR